MAISKKMIAFAAQSSWIRKMFEEGVRLRAEHGAENVFDFSLGNPDLPPPVQFDAALQEAIAEAESGAHSYMPNSGYPAVRTAVARQISREQGMTLSLDEVLMTVGAAGGLNVVLKALLDPGDEVIILAPFFVEYNFYVDNHGGISKIVNTKKADFSLDLDAIAAAIGPQTKALIVNSPNNPSGQIYAAAELAELGEILNKAPQTIYLIADEPYRKIVYDHHLVPSVFKAYRHSLVVSSYSKDLSLPGERIGYIAVQPEITGKAQLINVMTMANRILGFVNAPAMIQRVVGKMQGVTVDTAIYARRRDLFCQVLRAASYQFVSPKGAFYIFPQSPLADDTRFIGLLAQQRILGVPGCGFGMTGYFRLAFCVEDDLITRSAVGFKAAMLAAESAGT
ncbi:MAG: pyridoxal phosphate-dependent aminotransferase [Desulfobulbaceae bacterium]|nr:MAG: pyridoxal phosphate-dependent aminotransferase [Desulfobulbaceae bacterium]